MWYNIYGPYSLFDSIQVDSAVFLRWLYFGEILRHLPPLEKILVTPLLERLQENEQVS